MKKNQPTENTRLVLTWEKEIIASLPTLQNHIEQKTTQTQIRNTKSVDKYDEYSEEYDDDDYDHSREEYDDDDEYHSCDDFPSLPQAQEKSLSGKAEINTSFLKPYKNIIQSEKSLIENNSLSSQQQNILAKFLNIKDLSPKIKRGLKIFVIILNLIHLKKYPVYGYWECVNGHSWMEQCSPLQQKKVLNIKSSNDLDDLRNSFEKPCQSCKKKTNILSFRIYAEIPSEDSKAKPTVEIICHLQWNIYYRVFGKWECRNCKTLGKLLILLYHSVSLMKKFEGGI